VTTNVREGAGNGHFQASPKNGAPTVAGLFSGIGGIELGLERAGFHTKLLCECDPGAQAVLRRHFPTVPIWGDVCDLNVLPEVTLVTAGFPCQDLSQAGSMQGISGSKSSLVNRLLDLLEQKPGPQWVLIENVSFMLHLRGGEAIRYLTQRLGEMGFLWAYRVIESRAFGLPQRRQRVFLLASRTNDPRPVLFGPDEGEDGHNLYEAGLACGFYWTEGNRGLGLAVDAVPPLKGGSTVGILSQPAIWMPDGRIVLPEIRDGERLQGFGAGWTSPAKVIGARAPGHRWKLVGNAVSVPISRWIGRRIIAETSDYPVKNELRLTRGDRWPNAAWGRDGDAFLVVASRWPVKKPRPHLDEFMRFPLKMLSSKATAGFLDRAENSSLRFPDGFVKAVRKHLGVMQSQTNKP
jgi:DNA (cytosine-5)-methyltransferase 1